MSLPIDEERPEVHELRRRLSSAESRAAEALTGRAAAEDRTQRALELFAAVSRLWEARTPRGLYAALDQIAAAVLSGRGIALYVREPECAKLRLVHSNVAAAPVAPTAVLGVGPAGRAAAERRTISGVVPGTSVPVVAVPLGASPGVIGSLLLYAAASGAALDADQLQFVEIVARHAGNALTVLSPVAGVP